MEIILTGFNQSASIRHYLFQATASDQIHHQVTVDADLDLMRRYGISIQEMPLLCRRLIEAIADVLPARVIFGELEMAGHARQKSALKMELEARRKPRPKFVRREPVTAPAGVRRDDFGAL